MRDEIHNELRQLLWEKDWKLDSSLSADTKAINTKEVARGTRKSLQCEAVSDREKNVARTFERTYEWVFKRDPDQQDGRPMWSSFLAWPEPDSQTPFWITGKPGSGKSTMMKLISKHPSLSLHLSHQGFGCPRRHFLRMDCRLEHAEIVEWSYEDYALSGSKATTRFDSVNMSQALVILPYYPHH
ncbi:hypothetical protein B0H63DRAFT_163599 [Podospora didyma]|uniref:Nephrocystin 3-like N-terminal domain-containing protein n=1 Tax=Podospora didyma TaxID=330526 RepID=A0AAE0NU28_9PEZI|nr:hypothetical protein B0H63DRAFT_163599 [Podospora didyma]